ncbi:YecA family protein [Candidatus Chlamydia corallus]|uniref:YecA family protein n=1 Tax=Candidatus Chlamydia corallus TaxID=2038470 RepID=UPI000C2F8FCF|nr:YecA family protein [Candidatus Chlamydia corallus]
MSKKINRNDLCPCGSNKKYKQCCLKKEEQTARYTTEGKFKFSAEVFSSSGQGKAGENCTKLFQRLSQSLTSEQKSAVGKFHEITKNKEITSKKALKKAQAKEEKLVAEKLQQHNFELLDTGENLTLPMDTTTPLNQDPNFVAEDFIPTQEDFRISENAQKPPVKED